MIAGCHLQQNNEASGDQLPVINYNGEKLDLNKEQIVEVSNRLSVLFNSCEDFYELIVTDDLIEKLKTEEQYLEIIYPEQQTMPAGKFGNQQIKRIFIPLTGKFASSKQLTFFNGISDFSNTPFSCYNGSKELITTLNRMVK